MFGARAWSGGFWNHSCWLMLSIDLGKNWKKKKTNLLIFSVQCHLLCGKKSPWSLTFLLLLCDDQKGDVFTTRHFQGTKGACSQFIWSNPGWRSLLPLSCKISMMFVVAFTAREAWRQNFEETAEWGMFLGVSLPQGGRGEAKQFPDFSVQCRHKQAVWEHFAVVNIGLASVSSRVAEHP